MTTYRIAGKFAHQDDADAAARIFGLVNAQPNGLLDCWYTLPLPEPVNTLRSQIYNGLIDARLAIAYIGPESNAQIELMLRDCVSISNVPRKRARDDPLL